MHFAKVEKGLQGTRLDLYDENLQLLDTETFADLYTLNFHLQTIAGKHKMHEILMVIYDRESGNVNLSLARGENSFFVS